MDGSEPLDRWCRGEGWAVGGLVIILEVDINMCGAVGVSDCQNFTGRLCV